MKLISVALLSAILWPHQASANEIKNWSLLSPGQFHDGEGPRRPGDGWYGLFLRQGQWRLAPAIISSRRVRDDIVDGKNGPSTGIEIKATPPNALAYLRHPSLRDGPVPSVSVPVNVYTKDPDSYNIPQSERKKVNLAALSYLGSRYELSVIVTEVATQTTSGRYSLVASINGHPQITMVSEDNRDDHDITLLWAGDLNHDGLLDFVIRNGWSNGDYKCLFLSRKAAGASYERAGCHHITGC